MFDNPLIWIAIIWWLLSTFLGSKKRRRRTTPAAEPVEVAAEPVTRYEEEVAWEAVAAPPEPDPAPRKQPRTLKDLAQMWQSLEEGFAGGDSAPGPQREPAAPPPPKPVPAPVEPPPQPRHQHHPSATPGRPPQVAPSRRLTADLASRFTPLQQAIIYREIFDRPWSLRKGRGLR